MALVVAVVGCAVESGSNSDEAAEPGKRPNAPSNSAVMTAESSADAMPSGESVTPGTSSPHAAESLEDLLDAGFVALCQDGGLSDNTDFRATCSGGGGIDRWLGTFGHCHDGHVIVMSEDANCDGHDGFDAVLPTDFVPTPEDGDVARCGNGTYSDNTRFDNTCSANGGVAVWLASYGECEDGTVIEIGAKATCSGHGEFVGLLPDYVPPATTTPPAATTLPSSNPSEFTVTAIVDGDTIEVSDGAQAVRVRLIGIDAPEGGNCVGAAATWALSELAQGQQVILTPGRNGENTDQYGRLLRYVDVNGVDAALRLIEGGFAVARYDSRDGYGAHDREERYVAADAASADYTCPPPPVPSPPPPSAAIPAAGLPAADTGCDPNYSGCVPIDSDVDCAGGSGNGPSYTGTVRVIGVDIYDLDRDGDGVACE